MKSGGKLRGRPKFWGTWPFCSCMNVTLPRPRHETEAAMIKIGGKKKGLSIKPIDYILGVRLRMHLSRCQCPCSPLRTNSFQSVHERKLPEHAEIRRGTDCNGAVEYIQQRLYLSSEWSPSVYRSVGAARPSRPSRPVPTCLLSVTGPSTLLLTEPCPALPLPNGRIVTVTTIADECTNCGEVFGLLMSSFVHCITLLSWDRGVAVCLLRFRAPKLFFIPQLNILNR